MAFPFKKVMILATIRRGPHVPERFLPSIPLPTPTHPSGSSFMLKVIASAVILAILGVLFIVYNRHDGSMVGFGWFLIIVGALVAVLFTYLFIKGQMEEPEPEPAPKGRRRGRK
jgi:hypothetical protein